MRKILFALALLARRPQEVAMAGPDPHGTRDVCPEHAGSRRSGVGPECGDRSALTAGWSKAVSEPFLAAGPANLYCPVSLPHCCSAHVPFRGFCFCTSVRANAVYGGQPSSVGE